MKFLFESRASVIIYKYISQLSKEKIFLIPANVCPIVPMIFLKANIPFEFIDISMKTLEIDAQLLYDKIQMHPKVYGGLLWVRTYGAYFDNEELFNCVKELNQNIIIIDDRCLLKPDFVFPKTICDLVIYSTGYSKYIDLGWGGYAFINNKKNLNINSGPTFVEKDLEIITNRMRNSLINNVPFEYHDTNWLGGKKLIEDFTDYKNHVINKIPAASTIKEKINSIYSKYLPKEIQFPPIYNNWRFNIFVTNKKELIDRINSAKLFASSHYSSLTSIFKAPMCHNAQKLGDQVINLNNDFRLNEQKAKSLCTIIRNNVEINKTQNFL